MRNITDQTTIDSHFAKGDELEAEQFPQLAALSCGWIYQFMPVARVPEPPEVVFVPPPARMEHPYFVGVLATWNHLWESAQYRVRYLMRIDITSVCLLRSHGSESCPR